MQFVRLDAKEPYKDVDYIKVSHEYLDSVSKDYFEIESNYLMKGQFTPMKIIQFTSVITKMTWEIPTPRALKSFINLVNTVKKNLLLRFSEFDNELSMPAFAKSCYEFKGNHMADMIVKMQEWVEEDKKLANRGLALDLYPLYEKYCDLKSHKRRKVIDIQNYVRQERERILDELENLEHQNPNEALTEEEKQRVDEIVPQIEENIKAMGDTCRTLKFSDRKIEEDFLKLLFKEIEDLENLLNGEVISKYPRLIKTEIDYSDSSQEGKGKLEEFMKILKATRQIADELTTIFSRKRIRESILDGYCYIDREEVKKNMRNDLLEMGKFTFSTRSFIFKCSYELKTSPNFNRCIYLFLSQLKYKNELQSFFGVTSSGVMAQLPIVVTDAEIVSTMCELFRRRRESKIMPEIISASFLAKNMLEQSSVRFREMLMPIKFEESPKQLMSEAVVIERLWDLLDRDPASLPLAERQEFENQKAEFEQALTANRVVYKRGNQYIECILSPQSYKYYTFRFRQPRKFKLPKSSPSSFKIAASRKDHLILATPSEETIQHVVTVPIDQEGKEKEMFDVIDDC
jgi:hypothetical protein